MHLRRKPTTNPIPYFPLHFVLLGFPELRQELFDLVDGSQVKAVEDILQPDLGIDAVLFAGGEEGVDHG